MDEEGEGSRGRRGYLLSASHSVVIVLMVAVQDVLWYVVVISEEMGISLSNIAWQYRVN